jgi:hypothetical protein
LSVLLLIMVTPLVSFVKFFSQMNVISSFETLTFCYHRMWKMRKVKITNVQNSDIVMIVSYWIRIIFVCFQLKNIISVLFSFSCWLHTDNFVFLAFVGPALVIIVVNMFKKWKQRDFKMEIFSITRDQIR